MIKENRGVTLIALVITIIVFLILAIASFNLVVGDNGIFGQTTNVADNTNEGVVLEQLNLAVTAVVSDWTDIKHTCGTDRPLWQYIDDTTLNANLSKDIRVTDYYVNYLYNENDEITTSYTTTVEYKGQPYYFVLTESLSGNSCSVTSVDEPNSYVAE